MTLKRWQFASVSEVTRILNAIEAGEPQAAEELLPIVYDELRSLAAAKMAHEPPGQTLQATALVHEAWLQLVDAGSQGWNSRNHFFKAAAEAMRRILIAKARRKKRLKHGGEIKKVPLEFVEVAEQSDPETLLLVNEALDHLAVRDPVKAELVKLKFFIGLNNEEAAPLLGLSVPTLKRYWAFTRAWMFEEITRLQKD